MAENIYMQLFLGYTSFTYEPPFDASLFVDFRKRLGMDGINSINEKIAELKANLWLSESDVFLLFNSNQVELKYVAWV